MNHEIGNQRWCQAGSSAYSGENPSVRNASLANRNPARNELVCCGIDYGLACAQKKSNRDEEKQGTRDAWWNQCRQGSEDSPPNNARGQHTARAKTIGEVTSNRLK